MDPTYTHPTDGGLPVPLTAENLILLLAAGTALAFDHIPGLRLAYQPLPAVRKRQIMTLLLAGLVAAVAFGSCKGWLATGFACEVSELPRLLQVFLLAAAGNQAAHALGKPQ